MDNVINEKFNMDKKFSNMDDKVYFLSAYNFVVKNIENGNEVFYDAENKTKLDENIDTIKNDYKDNKAELKSKIKDKAKSSFDKLKANNKTKEISMKSTINAADINSITPDSQIIYVKYDVPNVFDAYFYTTDETHSYYGEWNNCAPTAGLTMIMYWCFQRDISDLYRESIAADYEELYKLMKADSTGTTPYNCYEGILKYGQLWAYCPAVGSNTVSYPTFSQLENNIEYGNPVILTIYDNPKYGDHSIVLFGTEDDSDGQYCRIADGCVNSHQVWYHFEYLNPEDSIYARWQ